jgi:EF hand
MTRLAPLVFALIVAPGLALAQDGDMARPLRDPATVPVPADTAALLRLGSRVPVDHYANIYDRLAVTGAIPVVGPGASLEIRAAADRARVFLAWTQYDLDGDGQVGRGEFDLHAQMSWGDSLGEREYALLDGEWAAADGDANGVVTLDEILTLARAMHPVPDTGPLGPEGEAMLLMDLDNDGFVTWDEVEAVLRSRMP